jgi:hypothetical protein
MSASAPLPSSSVSCEIALPFPKKFELRPVLAHAWLASIVRHKWFSPLSGAIIFLYVLLVTIPEASLPVLRWFLYSALLIVTSSWGVAASTQADRRLLRALARSFEWWLLNANLLVYVVCRWMELGWSPQALLILGVWCGALFYAFSLDAMLQVSRRGKGIVLLILLVNLTIAFVTSHLGYDDASLTVTVFLYRTDTGSLKGSALTSMMLFLGKYFLALIFRPRRLLIVSSAILYDLVEDGDEQAPAALTLQHYETRLLDEEV